MQLESITLKQFRNYEHVTLNCHADINLFVGENAQGKTNLLEAIFALAMVKSHRTTKDKQMIHWNEEYARIEGKVLKSHGHLPLELVISKKGKRVKANHLEKKKLSDYLGALNVVMFAPEDLYLIKGSPQVRRRFIDMEMGQIYPLYVHELRSYFKVLQQRNALLKSKHVDTAMLDVLTEQLITSAVKIIEERKGFLQLLQKHAGHIHEAITRKQETMTLQYKSQLKQPVSSEREEKIQAFRDRFIAVREREIERGMTLLGPHRDDLLIFINNNDVQTYGSQGQQRSAALSLKLAEIELIAQEVGEYPLLLLDDVLSELDHYRQSQLLDAISGKVQTFVTATDVEGIHHDTLQKAAHFKVLQGEVVRIND